MSIDELIEEHIRSKMAEAYPAIGEDEYLVLFSEGRAHYDLDMSRDVIGSEELIVNVIVESTERFDRVPFWRAFNQQKITLGSSQILQEYKGHKFRNFTEQSGHKTTTFTIAYTVSIFEA